MARRPKQRHINCFVEIVRQGTIAAAADRLSLTQPAVSRTLADLETILNARLMERTRSGITLTAEGETFLRYASSSLSALDQGIQQVARSRRDGRQSVNVGVLPNVAAGVLPCAIRLFKAKQRDVLVRIVTGTNHALTQALRQGEIDFMVGRLASPEDMSGLRFEPLFQEDLVAVVRRDHPLFGKSDPIEIAALLNAHTVLLPAPGTIIREDAEQLLLSIGGSELADVVETRSVEFGRAYVAQTTAIWITPRGTVALDIDSGSLMTLPLDTNTTKGAVGITTRQGMRLSSLAHKLAAIIRQSAAKT